MYYPYSMISFENIHKMNNRAMPEAFMTYKSAIQLFKLYNSDDHTLEWVSLNVNQIITTRQSNFIIMKTNRTKVGLNILSNRLHILNGMIPLISQSVHSKSIANIYYWVLRWSCIEIFQDSLGLSGAEGILNQPNASDHLSTKGCVTTNNIKCVNYFLWQSHKLVIKFF